MSKIKILGVNDPAVLAYTDETLKILENYKEKVQFDIVDWDKYSDYLEASFRGEKDYDIVMVAGHLWLTDFVHKGYLYEVHPEKNNEYDYLDIIKTIRDEISVDGKKYLYPSFCDGHILLYRKSVIKELLYKELEETVSTDDIIELAKVCHGYNKMDGIALKAHKSEIFLDYLPYLRNEGIDAFVQDSFESNVTNTSQGYKALQKYKSLKDYAPKDTNTFGNDEVREAFQKEKVALAVTWGGQLGTVLSDECLDISDVGFAALKTSWNVTWSFGICKNSKNTEECEKILQYLTSKNIDRLVGGYSGSPVRKSTYHEDRDKYNWYDIHLKLIEDYAKPLPSMVNASSKLEKLYDYVYEGFNS